MLNKSQSFYFLRYLHWFHQKFCIFFLGRTTMVSKQKLKNQKLTKGPRLDQKISFIYNFMYSMYTKSSNKK